MTIFPECREGGQNATIPGPRAVQEMGPLLPLWADLVVMAGSGVLFMAVGYIILYTCRHPGKHYNVKTPELKNVCCKTGKKSQDTTDQER